MNYSSTLINKRPRASKVTKNPIVNIGEAITINANAIANSPNIILLILVDDFLIYDKKAIDILSIHTTNNEIERRNTRNSIPNPRFKTAIDKAMAMIPIIICKILMHLKTLFQMQFSFRISFSNRYLKSIYLTSIKINFLIEGNKKGYEYLCNLLNKSIKKIVV
jgi:hypothetical protein